VGHILITTSIENQNQNHNNILKPEGKEYSAQTNKQTNKQQNKLRGP
jgi:hypothetical protein